MFSFFRKPKTKPNIENKNETANLESFLIGTGTDRHGRTYNQIIRYNDLQLESRSFVYSIGISNRNAV